MRALVTGGAGFIGSHICQELLSVGHQVLAIDNLASGRLENFKEFGDTENFGFHKFPQKPELNNVWAVSSFKQNKNGFCKF